MRKRISKYKHLHSNRFRYWCSSIPLVCASGLVLVLGMMISPIGISERSYAYKVPVAIEGDNGSSTVSIELDDPEITNLSTSANATEVAYISKGFTVTASNDYNIYVQTSNNSSDLTNGNFALRSISGSNVAPAGFSDNTWGYTVADNAPIVSTLTYNAIPTSTTSAIKSGNDATGGKQFTLVFAAKFGNDATAGHYKTDVILSVAANPGEVTSGFGGVTTMQALTSTACKTATVGTEGQLIDTRDNKIYWVARLKDNNCWMTQNLDYDDPNSTRIEDSKDWTSTDANYRAYYDPGMKTMSPWQDVDGSYNAHYLVGNYYSFQSATNGTGSSATTAGANATGSICPTNWKLPTSNNTNSGSFGGLTSGLSTSSDSALRVAPYYFLRGGLVNSGALNNAGSEGRYWSSTASSSDRAYNLTFSSSSVDPSNNWYRYIGVSVRCLVQAETTSGGGVSNWD